MKYFIRFVGHIIQVPGQALPREVYYDVIQDFEKEDMEPTEDGKCGLKQFCNIVTFQLMEHGMVVPKSPNTTQDGSKVKYNQRMGIPKHMIAYVDIVGPKLLEAPKPVLPELQMFGPEDVALTETVN